MALDIIRGCEESSNIDIPRAAGLKLVHESFATSECGIVLRNGARPESILHFFVVLHIFFFFFSLLLHCWSTLGYQCCWTEPDHAGLFKNPGKYAYKIQVITESKGLPFQRKYQRARKSCYLMLKDFYK